MKVYLVIGGSSGNGRELIKNLSKNPKNFILLISRNKIDINSSNIIHYPTDLLNKVKLKHVLNNIKKEYKIDSITFFQRYRPTEGKLSLNDDFVVSVESSKTIIESMKNNFKRKGLRSIVIIGSVASKFVVTEQSSNYHIVKSSLVGLLNYYSVTLASEKIRVNMISPSLVLKDENIDFYTKNSELLNLYKEINPLGDIVTSKSISDLVLYLLSKKSKYITGQDIWIDGGTSLLWQEVIGRKLRKLDNIKITR